MVAKADYTHHIHAFQHPSFPKAKEPMDVNNHEHDHNITTEHEGGKALGFTTETPQTTKTGLKKKPGFPFKGKNS